MGRIPRLLPLIAVAIGGVLAVNFMAGARDLPDLLSGARAFAEEAMKGDEKAPPAGKAGAPAAKTDSALPPATPGVPGAIAAAPAPAVCAPTAAELAREAGLSPAELQMLQSLGARRGQLDKREVDLDVQLKLLAAAEAKLDGKLAAMTALKGDITGLLKQADDQQEAENARLVRIYEGMKPKDAAARMTILSDNVRLPIASKMKERSLSTVLGYMPVPAARELTEKLAQRYASQQLEAAKAAVTPTPAAAPAAPATPPQKRAAAAPAAQRPASG